MRLDQNVAKNKLRGWLSMQLDATVMSVAGSPFNSFFDKR